MTKIRPAQLQEIENEDFSQFASLAYAKGFLLIYGKFLEVDVTPYLEAFETSQSLTVDGYSYLQDAPEPEPARPTVVRRRAAPSSGGRSSFWPFIIGVVVLVVGFTVMKWLLQMQRLKPRPNTAPLPTATISDAIIAPKAQPLETPTPATTETAPPPATPTATIAPTVAPAVPSPAAAEPEVRRAEPVHPEDSAQIPTPTPSPKRSPRPPRPTPSPSLSPRPKATATPSVRPR